jgi:hypothetical protein
VDTAAILAILLPRLVHFTFTMPVSAGTPERVATIDGIRYFVRGSSDLNGDSVPVEVLPLAPENCLPALLAGYPYRSFRLSDPVMDGPAGFIQGGGGQTP